MGKGENDKISAKSKSETAHFSSLCYSADGSSILAGGTSKFICIYNVQEQILLKKFEITQNRSFDCMDETINRRKMTEFGNMALVEDRSDGTAVKLPGTKARDMSSRTIKLEVRVSGLRFSPTGRSFSAVTTEGLLIYSLDRHLVFDPFLLETKITPQSIRKDLRAHEYSKAIIAAFKLNEKGLIREVFESVPVSDIALLTTTIPMLFLHKILNFVGEEFEETRHIDFYLKWCQAILLQHGTYIKDNSNDFTPILNLLVKNISRKSEDLGKVCDHNKFAIKYLLKVGEKKLAAESTMDVDKEDENLATEGHSDDDTDMEELKSKWSDDEDDKEEEDEDDDEEEEEEDKEDEDTDVKLNDKPDNNDDESDDDEDSGDDTDDSEEEDGDETD